MNRLEGKLGTCNVGRNAVVATIAPHYGEEACLQGWLGSGTIFFSGCSMRCCFCQVGGAVLASTVRAADACPSVLELQGLSEFMVRKTFRVLIDVYPRCLACQVHVT